MLALADSFWLMILGVERQYVFICACMCLYVCSEGGSKSAHGVRDQNGGQSRKGILSASLGTSSEC